MQSAKTSIITVLLHVHACVSLGCNKTNRSVILKQAVKKTTLNYSMSNLKQMLRKWYLQETSSKLSSNYSLRICERKDRRECITSQNGLHLGLLYFCFIMKYTSPRLYSAV